MCTLVSLKSPGHRLGKLGTNQFIWVGEDHEERVLNPKRTSVPEGGWSLYLLVNLSGQTFMLLSSTIKMDYVCEFGGLRAKSCHCWSAGVENF